MTLEQKLRSLVGVILKLILNLLKYRNFMNFWGNGYFKNAFREKQDLFRIFSLN